jgi:hypothetical protein
MFAPAAQTANARSVTFGSNLIVIINFKVQTSNLKVYSFKPQSCDFAISDFTKLHPLARKRKKNAIFLPFSCDFLQIHLQSIAIHCNFADINFKTTEL